MSAPARACFCAFRASAIWRWTAFFVAVGVEPQTKLVQGLLALDDAGYILAGEDTCTSVPGIFAAGDCRKKPLRQVSTAVGDGATAAYMASAYLEKQI